MESGEEMEIDGVESVTENTTRDSIKQTTGATEKLQAGFGFTKKTIHVRLSAEKDQCTEQAVGTNSQDNGTPSLHFTNNKRGRIQCSEQIVVASECTVSTSRLTDRAGQNEVIETDTIYSRNLQERVLQAPPTVVPVDYVDMSPKKLPTKPKMTYLCMIPIGKHTPDASSDIYIRHEGAETPTGEDEFGARLSTFNDRRKDGTVYCRHFLVHIQPAGPADQMKIDDSDELVLMDEYFAPQFKHEEVIDLFKNVKVDGKTRFTLVVRRVQENKKWEWIETSAIFAPEKTTEEHPFIEKVEFKELKGEHIELPKSKRLFKVPETQQYLDICDGRVQLDRMKGDESDNTKLIWKRAKYWQDFDDEIHINFAAALADCTMTRYIGIQNGDIILTGEPVWFKMIRVGNKIRFKFNDVYLGYDLESNKVKVDISQCTFEEHQPSDDIQNNSTYEPLDSSSENRDPTSEDSVRHRSTASSSSSIYSHSSITSSVSSINSARSCASSQSSVESDRSSILSSQTSTDSGHITNELNRSCSDATDSCNEPSSLNLSQISGSSGYKSDNHTVTSDIDTGNPIDKAFLCMSVDNSDDMSRSESAKLGNVYKVENK